MFEDPDNKEFYQDEKKQLWALIIREAVLDYEGKTDIWAENEEFQSYMTKLEDKYLKVKEK